MLFLTRPGFEQPRPVQEVVGQLVQFEPEALRLSTINEAPMGEGKSEAALYLATN